jgi:hypothetical protein
MAPAVRRWEARVHRELGEVAAEKGIPGCTLGSCVTGRGGVGGRVRRGDRAATLATIPGRPIRSRWGACKVGDDLVISLFFSPFLRCELGDMILDCDQDENLKSCHQSLRMRA